MYFPKNTSPSSRDGTRYSNSEVSAKSEPGNPFEEYRKSLDIINDLFSDLPVGDVIEDNRPETGNLQTTGPSATETEQSAQDLLSQLATGGIGDFSTEDIIHDFAKEAYLNWTDEVCKESSKTLLQAIHSDHPYLCKSQDTKGTHEPPTQSSSCASIPDAELIHDFFLHTTNMIAYRPITEAGSHPPSFTATTLIGCPQVKIPESGSLTALVQKTCEDPNEQPHAHDGDDKDTKSGKLSNDCKGDCKPDNIALDNEKGNKDEMVNICEEIQKTKTRIKPSVDFCEDRKTETVTNKRPSESSSCERFQESESSKSKQIQETAEGQKVKSVQQSSSLDDWTAACKAVTDRVEEESLLKCAVTLMMKVWRDYLNLTFEQVRKLEIENGRQINFTDEVIEMLEDKDRYVWQIIEEMEPRNTSTVC